MRDPPAVLMSRLTESLTPILIRGGFLKGLLFKLIGNFRLFTGTRTVNNIAVNNKRIYSRILTIINCFFKIDTRGRVI